jgi:hypothetical protein
MRVATEITNGGIHYRLWSVSAAGTRVTAATIEATIIEGQTR